jgi:hypothetical protein
MTLLRSLSLLALWALSTAAVAQTCPAGNPRVAPDSRYSIDSATGVVTDLATGLMWKRCSEGHSGVACATDSATTHTWSAALDLANASTHAGFTDWRLPNAEELYSLVETACASPSVNTIAFPATATSFYWSSTSRAVLFSDQAFAVNFNGGILNTAVKSSNQRVRLVRGGQGLDTFASEADAVPDAFSLLPQVGVPRSSLRTSDPITVAGLTTVTGIGVSGAAGSTYSINGGPYTRQPGAVANGDVVRVRHTSSAAHSSPTTTVLSIGGVTGEFVTHTRFAVGLNDSAQITCYNADGGTGTVSTGTPDPEIAGFNEQDCTRGAAAADALGRMAKVGASVAPGRDYTKIANDGSVLPASATLGTGPGDWGCTRDNVTGLIWEVKTTSGLRSLFHSYTWYDTNAAVNGGNAGAIGSSSTCGSTLTNCNTTAYRNAINALTGSNRLCGATDWRLPTGKELRGLVHSGLETSFLIDTTWFPNTNPGNHWTVESSAANAANAWFVDFSDFGTGVSTGTKLGNQRVRLVRGGP